jgi:glycosyltransferase involved in cell wall biosynthesis
MFRTIRPTYDFREIVELRLLLAKLKPHLVSTHSAKAGLLGRLAARSLGIPVLFTAHGWPFTEGVSSKDARFYRAIEHFAALFANKIITVSEADRQLALQYRIASKDKLVTVHNGRPDIPSSLGAHPNVDPVCLVMVARFEEQKDHQTLLQALAPLRKETWKLKLIGDGPMIGRTNQLAQQLGIAERVEFMGERKDVAEQLAMSQVFLLISNWEGFPRSIIEAMRAGLPVIASDVGGSREAVLEGETGYLITRGDVDTLRMRLLSLLQSASLRVRLGHAGRRRYEAHFTFEHMMRKTLVVYDEVLAG